MASIKMTINKKTWAVEFEGIGYRDGKCVTDINEVGKILGATTTSQKSKQEIVRRTSGLKRG